MSQAVITKSFSEWKAQQAVNNKAVVLDEFVFAYIPDLDVNKPISNTETIPAADKIVHRQAVSKCGVVNDNSVVYSITLGADVGDFDFNWIGLTNKATGTLAMIIHAPAQSKVKNASGQQGNVLVRSMLMEYSGAQAATEITTPAETWQIDFTARLAAMDERQRLENVDQYGPAAFFGEGYLVAKSGTKFLVTKGAGYVAGLRTTLAENQNITISTKPVKVWLDVSWSGTLTSAWEVQQKFTVADTQADYEQGGVRHFVFALASIDAAGVITDLRPKGGLSDQALKEHEKSRNHPDGTLNAKGFVQLSSATDSDSESLAATSKAVKAANDNANGRVPSARKVNSKPLSGDITLSADDVVAVPSVIRGVINGSMPMASANKTGWWQVAVPDTSKVSDFPKKPNGSKLYGYGYLFVWITGGTWFQHYYAHHGEAAYRQDWNVGPSASVEWNIDYNTANKPAATDVGALPLAGGKMLGDLTLKNGGLIFPEEGYKNKAFGRFGTYAADSLDYRWELYAISQANNNLRTNVITADVADISKGNVSGGDRNNTTTTITLHGEVMTPFKFTPGNYGNFDARYQAKGNYTPAGQAYTKAESDARYNLKNTAGRAANGWFKDNSTGMIFQWGTANRTAYTTTQSFPIAFPSTCLAVMGSLATAIPNLADSTNNIHARLKDNKSFQWDANTTENKIMFFAIGY